MTTTDDDRTKEDEKCSLIIADLAPRIAPHMSDAAKTALRFNQHDGWLEDMVAIARMWDHNPDDDDIRQLGFDLSVMVEVLATEADITMGGLLSVPLLVPMSDGRFVALLYTRVLEANQPEVRAKLRETLPRVCGLHALEQGEAPSIVHVRS